MRNHPRPFVVEVKRGTSRQSFQSHSLESDKFSAAEKLLFSNTRVELVLDTAPPLKPGSAGRVLPVLSDEQEIVLADPFPAPRRGRPPGSKNKVKQPDLKRPAEVPVVPLSFGIATHLAEVEQKIIADRHSGQELRHDDVLSAPALPEPAVVPTEQPPRAMRLRDRSRILRRYVLGIEPRAGERGSFRNRKSASAKAKRDQ